MARIVKSPEARKIELLDKAQELFFKKGYSDTTVRDIIGSVNGSQGMFYHYFESKEEIYQCVMSRYIEEYIKSLKNVLEDKTHDLRTRIRSVIKKVQEVHNNFNSVVSWAKTPQNSHFIAEIRHKIVLGFSEPIKSVIYELIEKGIMDTENIVNGNISDISTFLANGISGLLYKKTSEEKVQDETIIFEGLLYYSAKVLGIPHEYLWKD